MTDGYRKIENGVVDGYDKMEKGIVNGFEKVTDKCVALFFAREGETAQQVKARLSGKKEKD